jgi:hypothetical protein
MNKRTIVIATLLGAAILAIAGCENLAHDLHKKGGGAGKKGPQVPGATVISLSGSQFTLVEYNYTAAQAGSITVFVENTGDAATGPLSIALEGDGNDWFDYPRNLENIEPGGKDEFDITPRTGLVPENYVARVRVSGTGGIGGSLDRTFTVGFNGVIDVGTPGSIGSSTGQGVAFSYGYDCFTIEPNMAVRVTGSSNNANRIVVEGDPSVHQTYIQLDGAKITDIDSGSAMLLESGAKVTLNLSGVNVNELKTINHNNAGLEAPAGTFLTITGGGALEVEGGSMGAGIGGGYQGAGGSITINGGTVTALGGGAGGAGIGGGREGAGGDITINCGTVTAMGNSGGAGIGGGQGGAGGRRQRLVRLPQKPGEH